MNRPVNGIRRPVKTSICRCGCWRQVIYLWLPMPPDHVGKPTYRTVPCYPEGWDGSCWFTGQVTRHPMRFNGRSVRAQIDPSTGTPDEERLE